MNIIYNEDCHVTMAREKLHNKVNTILTSPPDQTSVFKDGVTKVLSDEEYIKWTLNLFSNFNNVLVENGCILYNMTYTTKNPYLIWLTVAEIIKNTNYTTVDTITWKKQQNKKNTSSKNKLSQITEYIFVFVRKTEIKTFNTNKIIIGRADRTERATYKNYDNFIEAPNNDNVSTRLNKNSFSIDLVSNLIYIYCKKNSVIYDPFIGVGTTAKAAKNYNINYIGSEIDKEQCNYSEILLHSVIIKEEEKISRMKILPTTISDPFWDK